MNRPNEKEAKPPVREKEVDLRVEELEEVIAPKLSANHNETVVKDVELAAEELEAVIAPRIAYNHNETLVSDTAP